MLNGGSKRRSAYHYLFPIEPVVVSSLSVGLSLGFSLSLSVGKGDGKDSNRVPVTVTEGVA